QSVWLAGGLLGAWAPVYARPTRLFAGFVERFACFLPPPPADKIIVFEGEAHRIDAAVATGADRVGAVLREHFPNCLGLGGGLLLESRNVGRRRGRRRAQNRLQDPGSAQYRARAIRIRRNRKNRRHAEESASCGAFRQVDYL